MMSRYDSVDYGVRSDARLSMVMIPEVTVRVLEYVHRHTGLSPAEIMSQALDAFACKHLKPEDAVRLREEFSSD